MKYVLIGIAVAWFLFTVLITSYVSGYEEDHTEINNVVHEPAQVYINLLQLAWIGYGAVVVCFIIFLIIEYKKQSK